MNDWGTLRPLIRRENPQAPLNWRVEKMKLSKDQPALICNDTLTLEGIPTETFEYRLGNPDLSGLE